MTSIPATKLAELWQAGTPLELLDVRSPAEFRAVHVAFARNIPLEELLPETLASSRTDSRSATLYLVCQSGTRSRQAYERLLKAGMTNVVDVEGGTPACVAAGLPVVRGQRVISLERQVRIVAGSLVLLGVLLAWTVHPGFVALSAFAGAGLLFAGVTDICGMGLLLARMPWNRGS